MMDFTCSLARITSRIHASWNALERILNLQGEGGHRRRGRGGEGCRAKVYALAGIIIHK